MDLRQIRYFIVCAEVENFHKASELLNLDPSALSRHIARLEAELGFQLFERRQKRIRLSPAGAIYRQEALTILNHAEQARSRALATSLRSDQEVIRIGLADTVMGYGVVQDVIHHLRGTFPAIHLSFLPMLSAAQMEALARKDIEIGILYRVEGEPVGDFQSVCLLRDQFGVLMPPDHRLAAQAVVKPQDMVDESVILLTKAADPHYSPLFKSACAALGLDLKIVYEADVSEIVFNLVKAGAGLTFGGAKFASIRGDLVFRPLEGLDLSFRLEVVGRTGMLDTPAGRFLAEAQALMRR